MDRLKAIRKENKERKYTQKEINESVPTCKVKINKTELKTEL